eukprot:gene4431-6266_t
MTSSKRFPGQSCLINFANDNKQQRLSYLNQIILNKTNHDNHENDDNNLEICSLLPLSIIIDNYSKQNIAHHDNNNNNNNFINLIKIDTEGSEISVLLSIRSDQWHLIQQVVIESNHNNSKWIEQFLHLLGFEVIIDSPWTVQTGNIILYAKKV